MAYTKTTWVNNSEPYLNATNLNKIETGIEEAHTAVENIVVPTDLSELTDNNKVIAANSVDTGVSTLGRFRVAVPASSVSGDTNLNNFPLYIDLTGAPSRLFTAARADASNIKVFDYYTGEQLPMDVQDFQKYAQTGKIWVKVPVLHAKYNTELEIRVFSDNTDVEPRGEEYGGDKVWTDYEAVFLGGYNTYLNASNPNETWDAIGNTRNLQLQGQEGPIFTDDDWHQGCAWDPETGNTIMIDTYRMGLYDSDWNVITKNWDPHIAASAMSGITVTHPCDGTIVGDLLIVPINDYPASTVCLIAAYNKYDLTLLNTTIVDDPNISGICWNHDTKELVTCSWGAQGVDWDTMHKYRLNLDTGEVIPSGSITLQAEGGYKLDKCQGIEYWGGRYWASDDGLQAIMTIEADGTYNRNLANAKLNNTSNAIISANFEGITRYKDGLMVLIDPQDIPENTQPKAYNLYWKASSGFSSYLNITEGYGNVVPVTSEGTFTIGANYSPNNLSQQSIAGMFEEGSSNTRGTLVARSSSGIKLGLWDDTNSWLMPTTPVNLTLNENYRINGVWDAGTSSRNIFVDGVKGASGSYTALKTTLNKFFVGATKDGQTGEHMQGTVGFAYYYKGVLSDDWIATEGAMILNPSFLTITEVATGTNDFLSLPVLKDEPYLVSDGMMAVADGVDWNPTGSGVQTLVVRLGGTWRSLLAAT